ncbi:hypothetical protein [Halobacteriovorax sp.]|uniref:hypothetical protein n=1 Tax=Halobacteriovorax sp. TaxID=2020862 RepID=UPI00356548AF
MRKAFSYFSKIDGNLSILIQKGETPSLPTNLDIECIELSKRRDIQSFFAVTSNPVSFESCEWRDILGIEKFVKGDGAVVCEALGKLFPLFNKEESILPSIFIKDSFNHDEAAFFGGSFNPWHDGHTECLKRCSSENIIIIPDRNPWKEEIELECFFKSFMELARKFESSPYSIYSGFYGLEKVNPTVDWLPQAQFLKKSLLVGDDNFCSLLKWKNVETLVLNVSSIYVLNRNHTLSEIEKAKGDILRLNKNLDITILGEHEFMSLSSTDLRAQK